MNNYWDVLPNEIQSYILQIKNDNIIKEQKLLIKQLESEKLINYSINKFDSYNSYISENYVCKIQKLDLNIILDLLNFEMILNNNSHKLKIWNKLNFDKKLEKCRFILKKIINEDIDIDMSGDKLYILSQYCFNNLDI
jgi:hypothetical protein